MVGGRLDEDGVFGKDSFRFLVPLGKFGQGFLLLF